MQNLPHTYRTTVRTMMNALFIVSLVMLQWMSLRTIGHPDPQELSLKPVQSTEAVVFIDGQRCKQDAAEPLPECNALVPSVPSEHSAGTLLSTATSATEFIPPIYRHLSIITTSSLL